jgi:hypothetical protein
LAINGLEHVADGLEDEFIGGLLEPALLGGTLFDELSPTADKRIEEALFFGYFGLGSGLDALGELSQDGGVEPIGLGVLAEGLGKIAGLPRVDQGDGQVGILDGQESRSFVPSGGFDHDQTSGLRLQMGNQFTETLRVVGKLEALSSGQHADIESFFGDIDAHEGGDGFPFHNRF